VKNEKTRKQRNRNRKWTKIMIWILCRENTNRNSKRKSSESMKKKYWWDSKE
jgi:hypothetical protein